MSKPKRQKKEPNPTLFVLEGSIRVFEEGSMLGLHSQITTEEWASIVEETIKYYCFLLCLKETACPALDEKWEKEDEYFIYQLNVAISRMRNIDPLLVASYKQDDIKDAYRVYMEKNIPIIKEMIKAVREEYRTMIENNINKAGQDNISVSGF